MPLKITVYLLLFLPLSLCTSAQNTIVGQYNATTKTFETDDNTYSIDYVKDGYAYLYKGGYVGLMDSTGSILCNPKYDNVFELKDGVALVTLNNKYGMIDKDGREVIPTVYESLVKATKDIYIMAIDRNLGLIDVHGQILRDTFANIIGPFINGYAVYEDNNYKYGLVNTNGHIIVKPVYQYLSDVGDQRFAYKKDNTFGLLKLKAKEYPVLTLPSSGYAESISHYNDNWYIRSKTKTVKLFKFKEGRALVVDITATPAKFGCIDKNGEVVIPIKYDWIDSFNNGIARAIYNGKLGIIDMDGKEVIPFSYSELSQINGNWYSASKDGKFGIINKKNEVVIPLQYGFVELIEGDRFIVSLDSLYGVIDSNNTVVLSISYPNQLFYLFDNLFTTTGKDSTLVYSNQYFVNRIPVGLISGETITDKIKAGDYLVFNKWGVIDINGKQVLPYVHDCIFSSGNHTGVASYNIGSVSLNTGIPRYTYYGEYFYFNIGGQIDTVKHSFSQLIEGVSDNYYPGSPNSVCPFVIKGSDYVIPAKDTALRKMYDNVYERERR